MDDDERDVADAPTAGPVISRRALFSRTLLAAGGAVTLFGLTGCPGGGDDDDDEDGEDDD